MPAELPDWIDTPEECTYRLLMLPPGENEVASALQDIELTRDEYDALKTYLAMKRGFGIGDFRSQFAAMMEKGLVEGYGIKGDEQQAGRHLQTARDFYKCCPDLVVYDSAELDSYLEELGDQ